jgi:hypothetical protein
MLSYLSVGDAIKRNRVHHVATFYGACEVCDPRPAVTQQGLRFHILKWSWLKIKFQILTKTQITKIMYNEKK